MSRKDRIKAKQKRDGLRAAIVAAQQAQARPNVNDPADDDYDEVQAFVDRAQQYWIDKLPDLRDRLTTQPPTDPPPVNNEAIDA